MKLNREKNRKKNHYSRKALNERKSQKLLHHELFVSSFLENLKLPTKSQEP
jgi:hypothetical protein